MIELLRDRASFARESKLHIFVCLHYGSTGIAKSDQEFVDAREAVAISQSLSDASPHLLEKMSTISSRVNQTTPFTRSSHLVIS